MKELTKAEEQIMHILWMLEKGFVKDIIQHLPQPRPAYNTVSTIVRILEKKGFIGHEAFGKTHRYFPLVSKEDYTRIFLRRIMKNYFDSSFQELVTFFAKDRNMSVSELEEVKEIVSQELNKQRKKKNE